MWNASKFPPWSVGHEPCGKAAVTARQRSGISIRLSVVVVGVIFVAVPSVFGIFPEMTEWSPAVRFAISVAWIGTVTYSTASQTSFCQCSRSPSPVQGTSASSLQAAALRGTRSQPRASYW